ncbi:MAG: acyl carrier protein [Deltaproteobacteria bacterium]|nr:acyl carrier protein [Deltaproteobacteria bacterium]MBN2673440.1 acyl carrier protein [Deltaproteobacteria bacterium]
MKEINEKNHSDDIEKTIADIISSVTGKAIESGVDNLQHLNLDSLSKLEIMTMIESRFDLSLTEETAREFTSISSIARIVARSLDVQ